MALLVPRRKGSKGEDDFWKICRKPRPISIEPMKDMNKMGKFSLKKNNENHIKGNRKLLGLATHLLYVSMKTPEYLY
jgi:hypothetical protein